MAENKLNNETQVSLDESELSLSPPESSGDHEDDAAIELTSVSLEDTAEISTLQAEETNKVDNASKSASTRTGSSDKKGEPLHKGEVPSIHSQVVKNIEDYEIDMSMMLDWKEKLKLTSIDYQLGAPYYEMWIKEANLFFRRLVILKKRRKMIKKQKRA